MKQEKIETNILNGLGYIECLEKKNGNKRLPHGILYLSCDCSIKYVIKATVIIFKKPFRFWRGFCYVFDTEWERLWLFKNFPYCESTSVIYEIIQRKQRFFG